MTRLYRVSGEHVSSSAIIKHGDGHLEGVPLMFIQYWCQVDPEGFYCRWASSHPSRPETMNLCLSPFLCRSRRARAHRASRPDRSGQHLQAATVRQWTVLLWVFGGGQPEEDQRQQQLWASDHLPIPKGTFLMMHKGVRSVNLYMTDKPRVMAPIGFLWADLRWFSAQWSSPSWWNVTSSKALRSL